MFGALALAGCSGVTPPDGGQPVEAGDGSTDMPTAPAPGAVVRTEPTEADTPTVPLPRDGSTGETRDTSRPLPFAVPRGGGNGDGSPQYEFRRNDRLSDPLRAHTQPRADERLPPDLQRRQNRIDDHVNAIEDRGRLEQLRRERERAQQDRSDQNQRPEPPPDLNERRRYGTDMRADRY